MISNPHGSDPMATPEPYCRTVPADCERHGAYDARVYDLGQGFRSVQLGCPTCSEESRKAREVAEAREAEQRAVSETRARIASIGIPPLFADRTLDNYAAECPGQERALSVCRSLAESDEAGRSLILCGKPGTGKTHLACGIARRFAERGRHARFETVLSAVRHVRSTYSRASSRKESEALFDLLDPGLLILDEVGVQSGSEHERMVMFEIINERYQTRRSTILVSNLTLAELNDCLGDRVIDRFREVGGVIAFDWQSWRGRKAA